MTTTRSRTRAHALKALSLHVLVLLVIQLLYFVSLSYFLAWLLPDYSSNVNANFVSEASKFLMLLVAGLYLVFFLAFRLAREHDFVFRHTTERPHIGDCLLILLPLTPVAQYVINNQDILSTSGSLYVLAVFAAFSLLFVVVMPALLGVVASTRALVILGLSFAFMITDMASLSASFRWLEQGSLIVQLALLGAVVLVVALLYNLAGRKFVYSAVALFFVVNSASQVLSQRSGRVVPGGTDAVNELAAQVASRRPLATPNIYFLIYDSYVVNETMLSYGIDNSAQERFLESSGFKIYPRTYSIASYTLASMSQTLNASQTAGGGMDTMRESVAGDGIVQDLLRHFGYETVGIFPTDFFFQGIEPGYDESFPVVRATHALLTKAVFMGEFRFDVEFEQPSREQFEAREEAEFAGTRGRPRFVHIHDNLPGHSQNSGSCRPSETALFEERLGRANVAMKKHVQLILGNDPAAIIIVAGDHGPYLTKNCGRTGDDYDMSEVSRLDVQDRFGTFLAIRWPVEESAGYDDITVLQDVFPAVFAFLFRDRTLLDAKVEPLVAGSVTTSGVSVENEIIYGGINDGEPLFLGRN